MNRLFSYVGRLLLFCLTMGILAGCREERPYPVIVIDTEYGSIEAELFTDKAPKTAAAFLSYTDSGFYKRSSFYRILNTDNQPMGADAAELIQGGLWGTGQRRDYLKGIPHENTEMTGLKHLAGSLSMARQDTGTATTEFFICLSDQPAFDFGGDANGDGQGYAVFGRVVKGMDAVRKIYKRPEENQFFHPQIAIIDIRRK